MNVHLVPTLAPMARIYRLSSRGGASSPRFERYLEVAAQGLRVSGYNPMTSDEALPTIDALMAIDAEEIVERAASSCASRLAVTADVELSVTVATPGLWTDRLGTEVEHRLLGRTASQVLLWSGDRVTADHVESEATAQMVRLAWTSRYGPPTTVADAAGQEGLAAAMAGGPGVVSATSPIPRWPAC